MSKKRADNLLYNRPMDRGSSFLLMQLNPAANFLAQNAATRVHVHDTIERTWRHLNFFQFKTYIHCRVPRTECKDCGVKQAKVP